MVFISIMIDVKDFIWVSKKKDEKCFKLVDKPHRVMNFMTTSMSNAKCYSLDDKRSNGYLRQANRSLHFIIKILELHFFFGVRTFIYSIFRPKASIDLMFEETSTRNCEHIVN